MDQNNSQQGPHPRSRWSNHIVNWMIAGLVLVAAYFVIGEHWVHVAPFLPFLLLLSCPVMHLFMHHHHGHGGHHHESDDFRTPQTPYGSGREENRP
ncbi:MAG: DUF2933 domain-containing protein [Nevskia sp.]|nr:DUF2933 domain-containing protein [Nevskia sp.]